MNHKFIPECYEERKEDKVVIERDYHRTTCRIIYATPDPQVRAAEEYDYDDDDRSE